MKNRNFSRVISWLAVILWMAVIFLFSAQTADDSGNTSGSIVRWVVGLLYWDFDAMPQVRQADILAIWHIIIRKGAHFTEYAVLAILISNAIRPHSLAKTFRWSIPIAASALYAVTDELHQYFVPGRACRFLDVCIDTSGAAFGTGVFILAVFLLSKGKVKKSL